MYTCAIGHVKHRLHVCKCGLYAYIWPALRSYCKLRVWIRGRVHLFCTWLHSTKRMWTARTRQGTRCTTVYGIRNALFKETIVINEGGEIFPQLCRCWEICDRENRSSGNGKENWMLRQRWSKEIYPPRYGMHALVAWTVASSTKNLAERNECTAAGLLRILIRLLCWEIGLSL